MIISVTNLKGGVGKSVISRNLGVYFARKDYKTCIIDTDINQYSTLEWKNRREEDFYKVDVFPIISADDLVNDIKQKLDEDYQTIIIDGAPHLDVVATNTILISDVIIIPITPSIEDLGSYRRFLKRYQDAKALLRGSRDIYAFSLINRYTDRNNEDVEIVEAVRSLEKKGIIPLDSIIKERISHRRSSKYGSTALEWNEVEARVEMEKVCQEVEDKLFAMIKVRNEHDEAE